MTQAVQVAGAGFRPYEVRVGRGLLAEAAEQLGDLLGGRAVIVADGNVVATHARTVAAALQARGVAVSIIPVPPGEASKSWRGLETLCDALLAEGLDRRDVILALGGGVVGDLAGLAAALYMRGVDFVQLPTSLGSEYVTQFEALYPRLSTQLSVSFVPKFMDGVGGDPAMNLPDGLHPTAKGHERIAQNVAPGLREVLNELGRR